MKIGIVSDSHGRNRDLRAALAMLEEMGAEAFVHCGDIGGIEALDALAGRLCWFVWGNVDLPAASWRHEVEALGLPWPSGPLDLELAGKQLAVFHGHEPGFRATIAAAEHDYLLHGHSHIADNYRVGRTRIINPGALHRAQLKTAALLDLSNDHLEYVEIPNGNGQDRS